MKKLYSILFLVLPLFIYGQTTDLIISKYGEGSSNHKFLEIYNGTGSDIDLSTYAFPNSNNAPDTVGSYDYWNSFTAGAVIAAGDVYVITDEDADASLLAVQDQEHNYLSNGDDGFKLVKDFTWNDADNDGNIDQGEMSGFTVVDVLGDWQADPGSGWDVAGVSNATKDHTLTRKTSVCSGNTDWASSAGTTTEDSEWVVTGQNEGWDTVGSYTTACVSSTGTQVTIGTGTVENEELPIQPYYGYSYSQVIYTAAEIGVTGTINSVTYSANAATTLANSGEWVVYMGTTSSSSFSGTSDWLTGADLTQVFDGTVTPDGSGNVLVTLDTAFDYTGSNLVIAVDENASGYDSSSHDFYNTQASETRGLVYYSDGTNPDPASWTSGGYTRDYIANIVLDITESANVSADWSVSAANFSDSATVSMTVNNFTVGAAGGGDDGHWHYTVDGGNEVMVYDTNDVTLTGLSTGDHTLVAWLTDDNHQALSPAVEETITWTQTNAPGCGDTLSYDYSTGSSGGYNFDTNFTSPDAADLVFTTSVDNTGDTMTVTIGGTTENNYDWVYVTDGAGTVLQAPISGTMGDVAVTSTDGTINVYVASDSSVTSGPVTFTFTCETPVTYESIPWSDDFETGDFSAGWTHTAASGAPTSIWEVSTLANNTSGGANSARHNYSSSGTYDSYLVGPTFDLSGATSPVVSYSDYVDWTSDADTHSLVYSEDYVDDVDAATWVVLNDVLGSEDTWVANGPYALPTTGTVTIAFRYQGYYAAEWFVDDVTVEEEPVSNTVLADPTLAWLGYMNVFDLTSRCSRRLFMGFCMGC
ncbi:MAG: lamin tail domain-containing protein [Flavobacteriaceae bacterium]